MAKENTNNGTWREQRVQLKPSVGETVYFNDTQPNHILISNPSPSPIFIGVNGNVNTTTYDMVIPPYATKLYARMMGTTRLYMYSDTPNVLLVQVTSWAGEFDPASISQSMEMVGAGADGLLGIVEVNNILASLPKGTNTIGGVFITDFGVPLPSGNNKIGDVGLTEGTALIGSVIVKELPQDKAIYKKVTASAASDVTVKATAGLVYQVVSDNPENIQLLDGAGTAWRKGEFHSSIPLTCLTDIRIRFAAAGEAYVLYK